MRSFEKNTIPPVDRELLKKELVAERFVTKTNKGDNEIYVVSCENSPNLLREIGRLREVTFREAGGGTGAEIDLDNFDTSERPYQQLIVWSPEEEEIIGGYRFIDCGRSFNNESGEFELSTAHYFNFSDKFKSDYLPYTIELGRSWVQPSYQPAVNPRKGIFALANIWDGLNSIILDNPHIKYFFGKVTMYPDYNTEARNLLLFFMHNYFPDKEILLVPHSPLEIDLQNPKFKKVFEGVEFAEGFKMLQKMIRELGETIPPLLNIYMNVSPTMKTFGTAVNEDFGHVEETGILVTIADIHAETRERHTTKREG